METTVSRREAETRRTRLPEHIHQSQEGDRTATLTRGRFKKSCCFSDQLVLLRNKMPELAKSASCCCDGFRLLNELNHLVKCKIIKDLIIQCYSLCLITALFNLEEIEPLNPM